MEKKTLNRVSIISTSADIPKENTSIQSRKTSQLTDSTSKIKQTDPPVSSAPPVPKFLPYMPPPDTLIWDLCQAIEAKSWKRARRLANELIFYDPWRSDFYDLYYKIDEILDLIDQRLHPRPVIPSRTSTMTPTSRSLANIKNILNNLTA